MAERRVEIVVSVEDADANKRLDALSAKLKSLADKATVNVAVEDGTANGVLDRLQARVAALRAMSASLRVGVDDTEALLKLDQVQLRLDKLSKTIANPKITVDGITRAIGEVLTLGRLLDGLKKNGPVFDEKAWRAALPNVDQSMLDVMRQRQDTIGRHAQTERIWGNLIKSALAAQKQNTPADSKGGPRAGWMLLASLLGMGNGGGGGLSSLVGAGAAGGGGAAATAGRFAASPVGAGAILAGLGPVSALIDSLIGLGIGGGVGAGAVGMVSHFQPAMLAPGMSNIGRTLSTVTQSIGPSIGMMFAALGKSVQGMAPMLSKMFSASLPFIQAFLNLMTMAAKTILPAFTGAMKTMVSSGALKQMMQGFAIIVQGIAGFIKALGPGMKAGGETFRAIAMGIAGLLKYLGVLFGSLGYTAGVMYHAIHDWWDKLRHNTAVIFDGIRHEVAHVWDDIYQNTIAKVVAMYQGVNSWEQRMRHTIASDFDAIRHYIASAWDSIWNNTIGRVSRGINDVENWFHKLPPSIQHILSSLGGILLGIGKAALSMFLSGLVAGAAPIIGFVQHLASVISGILGGIGGAISNVGGFVGGIIPHAAGGVINEPIVGRGLRTGTIHTFGERGPELVTPLGSYGNHSGGGGNIYVTVNVPPSANPDETAKAIHQMLRNYRLHHGGQALGLG